MFEFVSPRLHRQLSNRMSTVNPISKFASAPKPSATFTNSYATALSAFRIHCSTNFSLIYLPAFRRIYIFGDIVFEISDDEPQYSDSNISGFYSDNSTYFFQNFEKDVCSTPISMYQQATCCTVTRAVYKWCKTRPYQQKTPWCSIRAPGSHPEQPGCADPPGNPKWPGRQRATKTPFFLEQ